MADNDFRNWNIREWEVRPFDRVCDLLQVHLQLITSCPDTMWRKFRLGRWAMLIRERNQNSNCTVIASHEGGWGVVNKIKELGVAIGVADSNDAVVAYSLIGRLEK